MSNSASEKRHAIVDGVSIYASLIQNRDCPVASGTHTGQDERLRAAEPRVTAAGRRATVLSGFLRPTSHLADHSTGKFSCFAGLRSSRYAGQGGRSKRGTPAVNSRSAVDLQPHAAIGGLTPRSRIAGDNVARNRAVARLTRFEATIMMCNANCAESDAN